MIHIPAYSEYSNHWDLDKNICMLNHGSFGATPRAILEYQQQIIQRMESEPVRFMIRELEPLWWEAKKQTASFLGADDDGLVFVRNATQGVNTIIHALNLKAGDEVLTTQHAYGACIHTLNEYSKRKGFTVKIAHIPYPFHNEDIIVDTLISSITPNTRLLLLDHVTSATGCIMPLQKIVPYFESKGIEVLVDGAHGPGMLPLNMNEIGASYYTGNCHKWICSPKGSAILHVREDKRKAIFPLQFSHLNDKYIGSNKEWASQFFWPGTDDFSAILCIPFAINYMSEIAGGWDALRKRNRDIALKARKHISHSLETELPIPDANIGCIANILIGDGHVPEIGFNSFHPIYETLFHNYKIEVPVFIFDKAHPRIWVRIAVQLYNAEAQYEYLGACLKEIVKR